MQILAKYESMEILGNNKYETKLTTELKDIIGVQQAKYLTPSSVLFSEVKEVIQNEDSLTEHSKTPARIVVDKAKYMRVLSAKVFDPTTQIKDTVNEVEALESVSRSKVDVKSIVKNTYQIKNKGAVSGISGYKAQKLIDIDKQEDLERELLKSSSSKYSPFLIYPMDEEPPMGDIFDTQNKKSDNILPLEYFIFPEHLEKDNVEAKYNAFKKDAGDGRVFGYTKFYDNHGAFTWKRCELLEFDPKEEKFLIKWIDQFRTKKVTRSNFYFESENKKEYFRMLSNAIKWRELSCTFMRYLSLIDKQDTPPNHLPTDKRNAIVNLLLNWAPELRVPRNPLAVKNMTIKQRFNCREFLDYYVKQQQQLSTELKYGTKSVVDRFAEKKYDLNCFNTLIQEIDQEFVRANHQIEIDNNLPYNDQLQKMFKGYLDDSLFLPLHIRLRKPAKQVPLSPNKRELTNYHSKFKELSGSLHQANPDRNNLLQDVNKGLDLLRQSRCFLTEYKRMAIQEFLDLQKFTNNIFLEFIAHVMNSVNETLAQILSLKNPSSLIAGAALPEAQPHYDDESWLKPSDREALTRFMRMMNFKFEYNIRYSLRESILAFNSSLRMVLAKFERLMNYQQNTFNFSKIAYAEVNDYQNHMKEQRFSPEEPLILVQLVVVEGAIMLEPSYTGFKEQLKGVG